MELVKLLQDLAASISALQAQLVDAQAAAQAQYDKGFEDGKASVSAGFTQADIDVAVAAAVSPLNDKISALQLVVDGIADQVSAAAMDQKTADKASFSALVAAEDADLLAKVAAL